METVWLLISAGLLFSILSALEGRVKWIASFCALFGEGCRRTEDFSLFKIPISWWGIGYYAALAFVVYFIDPLVFWVIMAGLGFELTFLWIMASIRAFCIFCMLNAVVVAGLVWVYFDPARIWQTAATVLFLFMVSNYLISRENVSELSPEKPQEPEAVVATFDGETITREELESPLSQPIYQLESKIYKLKRDRLEVIIQDALLKKEAERRGISREQLLDNILNGEREIPAEERKDIIGKFADRLKERYDVDTFLQKPSLPLTQVDIEGRPASGPADASVAVVEFSDPLCPACRAANETTSKIKQAYGDRIRWIFKDFPLDRHPGAKKAAEAAHCAEEQGKFWEYHDTVISTEEETPDAGRLTEYAESLGLDRKRFAQCLENGKYRDQIETDIQDGKNAGISAVPTFIINGKMISGNISFDEFKEKIDAELNAADATRPL